MQAVKNNQINTNQTITSILLDEILGNTTGEDEVIPLGNVSVRTKATISQNSGIQITTDVDFTSVAASSLVDTTKQKIDVLVKQLCEKYPHIAIDDEILGEPRLAGTRFAVSNVLTALIMNGSFEELIGEYDGRYTEEQLKEAVKFARDFLDSFYRPQ